jgi:hypothetical protein
MSTWVTIAADDLRDYTVAAKLTALRTAALGSGQSDPFANVMEDVINTIRVQIQSKYPNHVSETALSIPPEMKTHVCWLIIRAMQARLPGLNFTPAEEQMIEAAQEYVDRVARGIYTVSKADDPELPRDVQNNTGVERVTPTTDTTIRPVTRTTLGGL